MDPSTEKDWRATWAILFATPRYESLEHFLENLPTYGSSGSEGRFGHVYVKAKASIHPGLIIQAIAVDPDHWREGHARTFLRAAAVYTQENGGVVIRIPCVHEDALRALLRSEGYLEKDDVWCLHLTHSEKR